MIRSRTLPWLTLALACGDPQPQGNTVEGPVTLSGVATYDRPMSASPFVLEHIAPDGARTVLAPANDDPGPKTGEGGQWRFVPASRHSGAFEIRVGPLRRYVVDVPFEAARGDLLVSPLTTWTAALADHLRKDNPELDLTGALARAEGLIHEHFGGPQVSGTPRSLAAEPVVEAFSGQDVQMGLVLDGLRELAHELARVAGVSADGEVTLEALTDLLAEDVADGVFDGIGSDGRALTAAGVPLTGDTLRASYALALRRFMDGPRNLSRFSSADIARWTDEVASRRSPIFPPDPPAPLDVDPPTLRFEPADGERLSGVATVTASASDMSALRSFEFAEHPDLAEVDTEESEFRRLSIDTSRLPDGRFSVSARATDVHGNQASASVTYLVDNNPPDIELETNFDEEAAAAGVLEVRALAVDFSELTSLEIAWPDGAVVAGERRIDGSWSAVGEWDSTALDDGRYEVVVTAEDEFGQAQRVALPVTLDNVKPGVVAGEAHWDSPISGLALEAFALTTAGLGPRVDLCAADPDGCTTDDDGAYTLRISDVYEGPVLIRAAPGPNGATRFDAAREGEAPELGALVAFEGTLETVVLRYLPGTTTDPMHLTPVTTIAAAWGHGTHVDGEDPVISYAASVAAWGRHFCPLAAADVGCDPASVRPASFGVGPVGVGARFTQGQLGLVAAGLSMQANLLNEAHDLGYRPETYLAVLTQDLADGVIDRAAHGELLFVREPAPDDPNQLSIPLSECALRGRLASAIAGLLRRDDLNRSPVRVDPGTNEWLHWIATESALWAAEDQRADFCPYDDRPPVIEVDAPTADMVFGPEGPDNAGPYALRLRLRATDDIALDELQVEVPEGVEVEVLHGDPDNYHALVRFEGAGAAFDAIDVRAVDWVGNQTSVEIPVTVDLEPPGPTTLHGAAWGDFEDGRHLTVFGPPVEFDPNEPIPVRTTTVNFAVVSQEEPIFIRALYRTGWRGPEHLGQDVWAATVQVPVQFGENLVNIEVGDLYGNHRPLQVAFIRDEIGPSLRLENITYVDAANLVPSGYDCDDATGLCEGVRFNVNQVEPTVVTAEALTNGSARFRRFAGNWDQRLFAVHPDHQPRIDLAVTDPFGDYGIDYRVLVADRPAGGEPVDADFIERADWRRLPGSGERQSLLVNPATIPGLESLASHQVVRVELQTRNRADRRASLAAHFQVRHLSPPLALGQIRGWKASGRGLGAYRFGIDGNANVLNLCNSGAIDGFRMTRVLLRNPWPFDAHARLEGGVWVRQSNRLAWRQVERRVYRADNCEVGEWRHWDSNADRECRDSVEQVTGQRWSAREIFAERYPMSVFPSDGGRLETVMRGVQEFLVVPAGRTLEVILGVSACGPPFIPDPENRGGHVPERPADLGRDLLHQAGYYTDRYSAVERMAALDFELTEASNGQGGGVRLRWYADIESAQPGRYDAAFNDTWRIEQAPLSMPEGQERRD